MATTSNQFRRKQDVILGIHVSNHPSRPTSQATLSRQGTMRSIGGRSVRTVGSIPAGISHIPHIPEEQDDDTLTPDSESERDNDSNRFMDIRRETESLFSRGSRGSGEGTFREPMTMSPDSENFDPFNDVEDDGEDMEDDEEYDSLDDEFSIYAGSMMAKERAASKRMKALRGGGSALRSSSALGFRSSSTDGSGMVLPSKAERMLGMAVKPISRARTVALRPQPSKSERGGLPSKAQRLLGVRPETIVESQRLQKERESSMNYATMTMNNRSGSDLDDFRRMLLASDRGQGLGPNKAGSTSDASSLSRSSLLDSQTSRSSRELFSPDTDMPTFTANNSTWMGIHPAFRGRKPSSDWDGTSPISPFTVVGKDEGYSGKMVVSDFGFTPPNVVKISNKHSSASNSTTRNNSVPELPMELHGGPPSPVELPGAEMDILTRSLPEALAAAAAARVSSAPSSPLFGPRKTATAPITVRPDHRAADDMLAPSRYSFKKSNRPSAIFDNPNIFEMPAEPVILPRKSKRKSNTSKSHRRANAQPARAPPTPPPSDKHNPNGDESPSSPLQSPHPPPSRPLPMPPQKRKDSETLAILPPVAFDKGRQRQHSEDVPISPRSVERRQGSKESLRSQDNGRPTMRLDKFSVPSPLEIAIAEGRPITKTTPPPLPSPDSAAFEQHRAAQQQRKRVELSDRSISRPKKQEEATNADPEYRPFSWQSTRTARSLTADGDAPPMPPPLALKIPLEASARTVASKLRENTILSATPLTANSARSRASRLEKALETALSKDALNMALSGESIEDLFRSAGANELFAMGIGPRTEGLTEEEDDADAKQTATRAQGILAELHKLQKEVDQLRKLYAVGGPLEGQSPIV